jgi:DNA adenine methylase
MSELHIEKRIDPFLKWAGGKRWLVPHVLGKLPKFNTYYEPFLGSGCLFFAASPQRAVLSDSNKELINCYRGVRNHCESIIKILKDLKVNKRTYYQIRNKLYHKADSVQRAAYFIYLNKMCWNGLYRVNSDGKFNVPVGSFSRAKTIFEANGLKAASKQLQQATLKCCDFKTAVKNACEGDLVYFDPPYVTSHFKNGFIKYNSKLFSQEDEQGLASLAKRLAEKKVSVVVSNAAHSQIKQLYNGLFFKKELERKSLIAANSNNRRNFSELLVTTFPLSEAPHE